jgi:cyclopropane fatty-acyl-phospholipid synthase-like methyltransferase
VREHEQYARQAEEWTERSYADARAYLQHRADLVERLGPWLERGDEVLDLACGDGGLGHFLLDRGLRYRGVDSTPEMAAEARRRLG